MSAHQLVETEEVELTERDDGTRQENDIFEHEYPHDKLESTFETNLRSGLSKAEAAIRLDRDGLNALTPPPKPFWLIKAAAHVLGGFSLLLWAASILCFTVYGIDGSIDNLVLGTVLAIVVLGTGIFSYIQELKSDNLFDSLNKETPKTCDVIRDGTRLTIESNGLVVGDVVALEGGKKVPADVIILETFGVKVDNSSLTGEAEPLKRGIECTDPSPWRTKNVAFYGTNCVEGTGKGLVVRTGDKTAIGSIASATQEGEKPETQMKIEIDRFVQIITMIAITIGVIFLIVQLVLEPDEPVKAVIFTISIIVANVPEGLLCTVTIALTVTAQNMANKNVLVKSTLIVETLGSVTAIASDKTGTLTQNRMTVRHAVFSDGSLHVAPHARKHSTAVIEVRDESKEAGGDVIPIERGKVYDKSFLERLITIAGLCNHAVFEEKESEILRRRTNGDASETALLKFCHSNKSVYELRKNNPESACLPFNSRNKLMITMHKIAGRPGEYKLLMKGAPEKVLERCDYFTSHSGGNEWLNQGSRDKIMTAQSILASNGERVLAFAEFTMTGVSESFRFDTDEISSANYPVKGYNFIGMLSLEDPPRDEVPGALEACQNAGIKVIMVTGDHPLTARSIASQIGILKPEADGQPCPLYEDMMRDKTMDVDQRRDEAKLGAVVNGSILNDLDEDDWNYILSRKGIVFARTLPAQKQEIVAKLQSLGECVAVTGDGVNDSPALKKADVGVAMGSGSEVAKEAGDLILMDDNFASIVTGVEEGRIIFSNLKKSIAYTLTSNIPEIIPFLAYICLDMPLGLTTIMILCIDLGTDILPAISFAYEPAESDVMKRPPRDRNVDKLVTYTLISWSYLQIGIIQAFAAFTTFFNVFNRKGFDSSYIIGRGFDWSDEDYKGVIQDNDGNVYDHDMRVNVLQHAQTAFLASIVICQIGCGLASKTRVNSLFSQGFSNMVFNVGVCQEIFLIMLLVYIGGINYAFGTLPIDAIDWVVAVPFAIAILGYDEIRKYFIRKWGLNSEFAKWFYF